MGCTCTKEPTNRAELTGMADAAGGGEGGLQVKGVGAVHVVARSKHPAYPDKAAVPDANVPWAMSWASYKPTEFTAKIVLENDRSVKPGGWADPDIGGLGPEDWAKRTSHEGPFQFDAVNRPLNPRGRTGMAQRGLLGKWGPNHAADPVVTRWHPTDAGRLQMVAIKRRDVEQWAIPGCAPPCRSLARRALPLRPYRRTSERWAACAVQGYGRRRRACVGDGEARVRGGGWKPRGLP